MTETHQPPNDARVSRARGLRRAMTDAEKRLWWRLRELPMEKSHFRRQATIGPYYADFVCHAQRLIIEVDGSGHAEHDRLIADSKRTEYLESRGYRVLRFRNNDVLANTDGVMTVIYDALRPPPTPPLPATLRVGGGERTGLSHQVSAITHG